jgi:hypothetical protein
MTTRFAKIALAVTAASLVPTVLASEVGYGRAGGVVGAQRIEQIASYVSPRDLREFDTGDGRAGAAAALGPARATPPARKVEVAATWYGRDGGRLPFPG